MRRAKKVYKYKSHLFTNLKDIVIDFENTDSRDCKIMHKALKPIIDSLQNNGIGELQDITMVYKDCGFNNESINQIILFLLNHFQKSNISSRDISKLNKSYRNIIFNYLFHEYPSQIIQLIDEFVSSHCPNIHNHDFLIYKLKQINSQNQNELSNENTKKVTQNSYLNTGIINKEIIKTDINSNKTANIDQDENAHFVSLLNFKDDDDDEFFELNNMQIIYF